MHIVEREKFRNFSYIYIEHTLGLFIFVILQKLVQFYRIHF